MRKILKLKLEDGTWKEVILCQDHVDKYVDLEDSRWQVMPGETERPCEECAKNHVCKHMGFSCDHAGEDGKCTLEGRMCPENDKYDNPL
jgi:hypothetical protein